MQIMFFFSGGFRQKLKILSLTLKKSRQGVQTEDDVVNPLNIEKWNVYSVRDNKLNNNVCKKMA